ncbi:MAG: trypsin-like peptidase domain-containing protein [Candidatus Bathyarchaeia archaeon]
MSSLNLTRPVDGRGRVYIYAAFLLALISLSGFFLYIYQDLQQRNIALREKYEELSLEFTKLSAEIKANASRPAGSLEQLTYNEIYRLTEPSVVKITVYHSTAQGLTPYGEGSGFVYDEEGSIITNAHVVLEADEIEVTSPDGERMKASLTGIDVYSDLAVVKVSSGKNFKPLKLGDSTQLYVGERVLAIGNPYGLSGTMTEGIVSQTGRALRAPGGYLIVGVVQTDAAINPGNSGGPLLNLQGEVIGVNTAIASFTGEFSGIGFAIPSNLVRRVVTSLIEKGTYAHPWLGVQGVDVTADIAEALGLEEPRGFLVTEVLPGSPAEKVGLKGGSEVQTIGGVKIPVGGDIIIGVDDKPVRGLEDILLYIEYNKSPSDVVSLTILRNGGEINVEVTLGERPPPGAEQ